MNCGEDDFDGTGIAFADPDGKAMWESEIEKTHPIINHYPRDHWARVTRINGWLPLPPTWLD